MPPSSSDYHADALALQDYVMSKDQSQLKNNPQAVLDAVNDYVNNVKRLMIYSDTKLNATEKVLAKLDPKPKVLVELGGYVGKSALAWGPMLMRLNASLDSTPPGDVRVFSLELEPEFCKIIRNFVELAGLRNTVEVLQGESSQSLRQLKEKGIEHIDILFLDHWEKFYLPDLRLCQELSLLKEGSVVVADNTDKPGAPEYLQYMEGGGEDGWKYRCESVDIGEGPGRPNTVHVAYVEATPS